MTKLAILGASGHGKVVADAAILSENWSEIVFFDDAFPDVKYIENISVNGNIETLIENKKTFDGIVIAIGNNKTRTSKQYYLEQHGCNIVSIIHPSAVVSQSAKIGAGSVVMAGAVINAFSNIGKSCIINTNAVVEHDCFLSDGVHVSPGALLAGEVVVGACSWIGIGSSLIQQISIGDNITIGAGSVVVKDIIEPGIYFGNPAKITN